MTSSEWEAANEDDADRWTRYQAHTGLAPDDGLVWRDRGVIIAQLTARIGELEVACQKLRDDYQGALARETALRGQIEALADEWQRNESLSADYQDGLADAAEQVRAAIAAPHAEDTTPAAPHAEDGACSKCSHRRVAHTGDGGCLDCDGNCIYRPAPVADPSGDTEGGQA